MIQPAAPILVAAWLAAAPGAGSQPEPSAAIAVPEPLRVELAPSQPSLVLGVDENTSIAVRVDGGGPNAVEPPRMLCNVGRIDPLERLGPREFRARYHPPSERFPQIAIIVAEADVGHGRRQVRGASTIRLAGRTSVPFRTDPGAQVTMRIGDKDYGPLVADPEGRVRVPVVVPPGVGFGTARSTIHGNTTEKKADLQLPTFNRLMVVAPKSMEVGATAEVAVYAVEADGSPTRPGSLRLHSSGPAPAPLGGSPGVARFLVEAPERLAAGPLRLVAVAPGRPDARADAALSLKPGNLHALVVEADPPKLIYGSGTRTRVTVSAEDQFGNFTRADAVELRVDGRLVAAQQRPDGAWELEVPAPEWYDGQARMVVEAIHPAIRGTTEVRLTGGVPARLSLEVQPTTMVADGRTSARVALRVADKRGTPTAGVPTFHPQGGRILKVESKEDGLYVARFVPEIAVESGRAAVSVSVPPELNASASVEVEPPFRRGALTPRAGFFSNLGRLFGPAVAIELTGRPPWLTLPITGGLSLGYLRDGLLAGEPSSPARLRLDQIPLVAVARYHTRVRQAAEIAAGVGAGLCLASSRLEAFGIVTREWTTALALETSINGAFTLARGQLVVGLRYLWVELGEVTPTAWVRGNTAGLVADVGYRFGI